MSNRVHAIDETKCGIAIQTAAQHARQLLLACAMLLSAATAAQAQRPKPTEEEPCCNITAINVAQRLVTAVDKTGKTFQFEVRDAALLKTLRGGQGVKADFAEWQVTINGASPCCAIINPAKRGGATSLTPEEPCCAITAIDAAAGTVSAREATSGRAFQFTVTDAALLKSLTIGQKVFADFATRKVRINSAQPCCAIVSRE